MLDMVWVQFIPIFKFWLLNFGLARSTFLLQINRCITHTRETKGNYYHDKDLSGAEKVWCDVNRVIASRFLNIFSLSGAEKGFRCDKWGSPVLPSPCVYSTHQ